MSSRWPLARNCHIVLSDLQQTVRLNRHTPIHSSSHGTPAPGLRNSFQAVGRHAPRTVGGETPDQSRSSKRRRIDPDSRPGHSSVDYSGGLSPHPNGRQDEVIRQADQNCAPGAGEEAGSGPFMIVPASRTPSVFPAAGQLAEPLALNQTPLHQQQPNSSSLLDNPIALTPDVRGLDAMGSSNPGYGGNDDPWMGGHSVGNWDGGMPDMIGGLTWESLLDVVNQDNLAGRGGFL